jgi:hypothetical protein
MNFISSILHSKNRSSGHSGLRQHDQSLAISGQKNGIMPPFIRGWTHIDTIDHNKVIYLSCRVLSLFQIVKISGNRAQRTVS